MDLSLFFSSTFAIATTKTYTVFARWWNRRSNPAFMPFVTLVLDCFNPLGFAMTLKKPSLQQQNSVFAKQRSC